MGLDKNKGGITNVRKFEYAWEIVFLFIFLSFSLLSLIIFNFVIALFYK